MSKCKDLDKDWFSKLPDTIEEAGRLNRKPNKKRLLTHMKMMRDYNDRVSGKHQKYYIEPLKLRYK